MQTQTEATELKPRMAMQQLPPSLHQECTVSMCQKAFSLKLAAALKQTKASWLGEQTTAGTFLGTQPFLRQLQATACWTQVVVLKGFACFTNLLTHWTGAVNWHVETLSCDRSRSSSVVY